jgi:hypothetical protein
MTLEGWEMRKITDSEPGRERERAQKETNLTKDHEGAAFHSTLYSYTSLFLMGLPQRGLIWWSI